MAAAGLFGKVAISASGLSLPYPICQPAKIAITADGNTTGLFLHAQIAEGAVRIAIFVLKNTRKAENVDSANIPAAGVRNMCR